MNECSNITFRYEDYIGFDSDLYVGIVVKFIRNGKINILPMKVSRKLYNDIASRSELEKMIVKDIEESVD
jgi:hypothetical protein